MYRTALLFLLLVAAQPAVAQQNTVSVTASGTVQLPADIIQFNINLNAEADSPQRAYELHKKREKVLVQALDRHRIRDEDVRYSPVSIHRTRTGPFEGQQNRVTRYRTEQQVGLTLSDFEVYEQIQITLIENGFDSFNGSFQSSGQEKGEDDALRRAIREARRKATVIAEEADIRLAGIKHVEYVHEQVGPLSQMESRAMSLSAEPGLMDYGQTIAVRATVNVEFRIAMSSN